MIYVKTPAGQLAFTARAPALTSKLRIAYLMVDGARHRTEILSATHGMGVTPEDIVRLAELGYIAELIATPNHHDRRATLSSAQQSVIFVEATRRATALTASMGLRGFRMNMAVESAKTLADLEALMPDLEVALGKDAIKPLAALFQHN